MKPVLLCIAALAVSTPSLSEPLPPGVNLDDPSTLASPQSCLAECKGVFTDCRMECGKTKARANEEHFDIPDVPVGECLRACQADLAECKQACD
jgi:hypothetical protein